MSKTRTKMNLLSTTEGTKKKREFDTGTVTTIMDPSPLQMMYLDKNILANRFEHSTQLMQQHKEEGDERRVKHDQRRRKFNRQVDTSQISFSRKFFENEVIGQILNISGCEKVESELRNRVLSYKEMMVINRQNRQRKIEELKNADADRSKLWEEVEAKREVKWLVRLDTNAQMRKRETLMTAVRSANRDEATSVVGDFINKLIELVDWTITCREVGGFSLVPMKVDAPPADDTQVSGETKDFDAIPALVWEDVKRLTASSFPFAKPLPHLQHALPSALILPFNISERPKLADPQWLLVNKFGGEHVLDQECTESNGDQKLSSYLCIEDWNTYLQKVNEESLQSSNNEDGAEIDLQPKEKDYLYTPPWLHAVPPSYLLGESIIAVRRAVDPIPPEPEIRFDTSHIPLRIALFGLSDVMRKKMSEQLQATIPRIKVITMEKLIQEAVQYYASPDSNLETEYGNLTREINDSLYNGIGITDVQYASLLVNAIKTMPKKNNGFVIEDYPSSREQLLLLLEALSGIRYDSHRPQPSDYESKFAPMHPKPEWGYDVKKCGLDLLVCVDELNGNGIDGPLRERVRARKNLKTQETVYLDDEATSVRGLQQLYDPTIPVSTAGIDMTVCEQDVQELMRLCEELTLLKCIDSQSFFSHEEAIGSLVVEFKDNFIPLEQQTEEFWVQHEEEELRLKREADEQALLDAMAAAVEAAAEGEAPVVPEVAVEEPEAAPVAEIPPEVTVTTAGTDGTNPEDGAAPAATVIDFPPNPPIIFEEHKMPPALAKVMKAFWDQQEQYADSNGHTFFKALQDLRFQTLQRRRIAIDTVYVSMMRYDNRQELFDEFRAKFNSVDEELRYDPDCVMEFHLRLLELRNALSKLCEERYQKVKEIITTIQNDNHINILLYHVKCESSFFLQNQLNEFYSLLQMIFDYTKSVQGFTICHRVENELEVLLPSTASEIVVVDPNAKGGKDKGKDVKAADKGKGKDKNAAPTFQPYREAIAPYFVLPVHQQMIQAIPNRKPAEEPVDPKAKAKPKDKKGEETVVMEPFQEINALIQQELENWKEGNFKVSRELYYNMEETLCANIEKTVWFEANKLFLATNRIDNNLKRHMEWMETMEKDMITMLHQLAHTRFLRELAAGEALCRVIEKSIAQALPISPLWLVTPDASSPVEPATAWERFRSTLSPEDLLLYEHIDDAPVDLSTSQRPRTAPAAVGHNKAPMVGSPTARQPMRSKRDDVKSLPYIHKLQHSSSTKSGSGNNSARTSSAHRTHSGRSNSSHHHHHNHHSHASFSINNGSTPRSNPSSSRLPNTGMDDHQQQEYMQNKIALEHKLMHIREEKEHEFVKMGMSMASAKLAAYNECLIEEEHQMADLAAHFHRSKHT